MHAHVSRPHTYGMTIEWPQRSIGHISCSNGAFKLWGSPSGQSESLSQGGYWLSTQGGCSPSSRDARVPRLSLSLAAPPPLHPSLPAPCALWPPRCALPFPLASSPSALQLPSPSLWVTDERAASLPPRPVKPLTRVHAVLLSCKSAPTPEEHAHTNHVLTHPHRHTECKHGPEAGLRSAS